MMLPRTRTGRLTPRKMSVVRHFGSWLLNARRPAAWEITRSVFIAMLVLISAIVSAQPKPDIAGTYVGSLGQLNVILHLTISTEGALSGTLDSPDQGKVGIACTEFHLDGHTLSFTAPAVHGSWKGTLSSDGISLSGTWNQGSPQELNFIRDFVPSAKPFRVNGLWLSETPARGRTIPIQLKVRSGNAGRWFCTVDSPTQHTMGTKCANVVFSGSDFSFDVPAIHGRWSGKLSSNGSLLIGTWNQGRPMALNLRWRTSSIYGNFLPSILPPPSDPARRPVSATELQSALDRDLSQELKSGDLAPGTGIAVAIGVVKHGARRLITYGAAKPDSIFEIGSITKTFTGLMLSQMVAQGEVRFEEPVRVLLPPGIVTKPIGREITLLDLATQHSGLPGMPDNLKPLEKENAFADYSAANLYAFLNQRGIGKPAHALFSYSNLGFGLLGQALANHAGVPYSVLLKREVADPLGLKDTTVSLSPAQRLRFIQGFDGDHHLVTARDLDVFAGAGGIRSMPAIC